MWRRLADWCVPSTVFAEWGTSGDGRLAVVVTPWPLPDGEYEQIKARWLAAHGRR